MESLKGEVLELFETLIESGIVFYYGNEYIPTGEITKFNILHDNIIEIELDGFEKYEVNIDEFIECHSKEGANYHTWPDIRKFDKKLEELLIMHSA